MSFSESGESAELKQLWKNDVRFSLFFISESFIIVQECRNTGCIVSIESLNCCPKVFYPSYVIDKRLWLYIIRGQPCFSVVYTSI